MGGFTGGGGRDASGQGGSNYTSITKKDATRFRKSKERTRKAVGKSKLDNYEVPKSDAPGMLGLALNLTRGLAQKTFEKNRDYFQKNVAGKRGFEDTYDDFEKYVTGRTQGNLDAMGREIPSAGSDRTAGIEIANQSGTLAKETQQAAVDNATAGPTSVEMPTEETEAQRLVNIKRKGRRATILNVPEEELTLSKKVLLG
jgi:hypothetical protein